MIEHHYDMEGLVQWRILGTREVFWSTLRSLARSRGYLVILWTGTIRKEERFILRRILFSI